MLSSQQTEKFIYDFRQQIESLQASQLAQNTILNTLQQQLNALTVSVNTLVTNAAAPTVNASDSYPTPNGILHKLKHIFNTDVLINGILTLTNALAIGQGGTGAITAAAARTNLSAAKLGANSDITSLTGLTTPLPITEGGTGSITAAAARAALSAAILGTNGDITQLTGLTTPLSIAQGGTNSTTAAAAVAALGAVATGVFPGGATVALAKLTTLGTDGSLTVNANGDITAYTAPT